MKKILFVLTSNDVLGNSGKPTGAFAPEIAHPYAVLKEHFEIDFSSTRGGKVPIIGVEEADATTAAFLADADVMKRVHASLKPQQVNAADYAAIFYAGGHGTMWDFPGEEKLQAIARDIYEAGGVVAAVCHGPAGLVNIKLSSGDYLVRGKRVAAFTRDEEQAVELDKVIPFFLSEKLESRGQSCFSICVRPTTSADTRPSRSVR